MSNFYSFLNTKTSSAIAQDAKNGYTDNQYLITCSDREGAFLRLFRLVRDTAKGGHSFNVVVDEDEKGDNKVFIDGDGSDDIKSIISFNDKTDLVGILLSNINTFKWICRGAIPDPETPDEKTDDPLEALRSISVSCDALLDGGQYDFGSPVIETLNLILKSCKSDDSKENIIKHIEYICNLELEKLNGVRKKEDDNKENK